MHFLQLSFTGASGEEGVTSQLADISSCLVVCLVSLAAFCIGRLLGSRWAASQKPEEENMCVSALLLLFQRLPNLPEVIEALEARVTPILGPDAWHVPCCCDVNARAFVDLVVPEWKGAVDNGPSATVQAESNAQNRSAHMDSDKGAELVPSTVKSDDVQKTKKLSRLFFFARRSKPKASTSTIQDVGQVDIVPVLPGSRVDIQCENGLGNVGNGIDVNNKNFAGNGSEVESASLPSWERLVEQKVMRLLSGASTMRNCHSWDVHYFKAPDILFRNDEENDNSSEIRNSLCGGILLRVKSHSMKPIPVLQLAVKCGFAPPTVEYETSNENLFSWTSLSNSIRKLARELQLQYRSSPSAADSTDRKGDCPVPIKNLVLLSPHAQEIPLRIATELNGWIHESIVTLGDVESVLLEETVNRLSSPVVYAEFNPDAVIARIIRAAASRASKRDEWNNSANIGTAELCGRRAQSFYALSHPEAARPFTAVQCEGVVCASLWLPNALFGGEAEVQRREAEQCFAEALGNLEEAIFGARRDDGAVGGGSAL